MKLGEARGVLWNAVLPEQVCVLKEGALGAYQLKSLVSLLEPVMVVLLGGMVGTIVVAMFLPSFFTGSLIGRFGAFRILWFGVAFYLASIFLAVTAAGFWPYWAGGTVGFP